MRAVAPYPEAVVSWFEFRLSTQGGRSGADQLIPEAVVAGVGRQAVQRPFQPTKRCYQHPEANVNTGNRGRRRTTRNQVVRSRNVEPSPEFVGEPSNQLLFANMAGRSNIEKRHCPMCVQQPGNFLVRDVRHYRLHGSAKFGVETNELSS